MQIIDCWQHVCVCMACFEWILLVCELTWVQANERIVFQLFAMVSCHAVSLSVCEHVFFFCLRVPKTPLNPANLNSTEMVRIIRVWIGASVGSRYAGWLMIPTPAASWLTPDCPSNIYCSSPPSTHPSWRWFRAYHKPGNRCQTPTSLPPVLFDSVSSHLRLSSLFLFTFCSFLLPAPVLSPPAFFFSPYFRKTTSLLFVCHCEVKTTLISPTLAHHLLDLFNQHIKMLVAQY